jgi:hypothetical protein
VPRVAAEQERAVALAALPTIRKLFARTPSSRERVGRFPTTPYIVFGAMCCAAAIVPSLATDLPFARAADAIALVGPVRARAGVHRAGRDGHRHAFGSLGARARCS